jgi:drug/metabolite transporter (DMT)-like permease
VQSESTGDAAPRSGAHGGPHGPPGGAPALLWGALGVVAFSLSLPMTRLTVDELDPTFVGLGRALVASVLAAALLAIRREPWPQRRDLPRFALVSSAW